METMNREKLERLIDRMKVQTQLSWGKEERMLEAMGLQDGMKVLEIGSGPGYITEQLLNKWPNVAVTGVEINREMAEYATEQLAEEAAAGRMNVVVSDILATGLPDNAYDFAFARLVFQHLPNPQAAAEEILRVLKPGGKLVITDVEDALWGLIDPMSPELNHILTKHQEEQRAEGGNRFIGRELWRILQRAGFRDQDLQSIVIHSDELGIDAFLPQMDYDEMRTMVESGFITEEDVQAVMQAMNTFKNSDYPYAMMLLFVAAGVK